MLNILTIDFEEWFQAEIWRRRIAFSSWERLESSLRCGTEQILELLRESETKATFFVVTYNASRYPNLIRMIAAEGHELGLHTRWHDLIHRMTPDQFRSDIDYSKNLLEDLTRTRVIGFRAPGWSVTRKSLWALDILLQSGFRYDTSMSTGAFWRLRHAVPPGLMEIPRTEFGRWPFLLPFAGGFFLRTYPYRLTKVLVAAFNACNLRIMTYLHPWELCGIPEGQNFCFCERLIQTFGISTTRRRLERLLQDFKFSSIRNIFFNGA